MTPFPEGSCPKCGVTAAFGGHASPRYVKEDDYQDSRDYWRSGGEYLAWPCRYCGYEMRTPTADARTPEGVR